MRGSKCVEEERERNASGEAEAGLFFPSRSAAKCLDLDLRKASWSRRELVRSCSTLCGRRWCKKAPSYVLLLNHPSASMLVLHDPQRRGRHHSCSWSQGRGLEEEGAEMRDTAGTGRERPVWTVPEFCVVDAIWSRVLLHPDFESGFMSDDGVRRRGWQELLRNSEIATLIDIKLSRAPSIHLRST